MSIASEITRLQNAKTSIKTSIENKGVEVGDITLDGYASKIDEISGGTDYLCYLKDIERLYIDCVFPTDTVATMNFDSWNGTSIVALFQRTTGLKEITLISNDSFKDTLIVGGWAFTYTDLETINLEDFNLKYSNASEMFNSSEKLKYIYGELDFSNITNINNINSIFVNCWALEEVRFKENSLNVDINFAYCPLLSNDTIQSIINGLADLTSATAQTLTFDTDVKAKLTDEQIASITNKNWTLA